MTQFAIWAAISVMAALTLQRRPLLLIGGVLCLRVLVPSQAGWILIGDWEGNAALHPATLSLIVIAPFLLLSRRESLSRELRRWPGVYFTIAFIVALCITVIVVLSGPTAIIGLANSLLASIFLFIVVRVLGWSDPNLVKRLVRVFLVLMVVEALLVAFQWSTGLLLPWSGIVAFPTQRPLGTFDSPLDLGLACAIAVPLLAGVARPLFRYGGLVLLLGATVLSESRTPTIFALLGAAYVVLVSTKNIRASIAMIALSALSYFVLTSLPVLSGLMERFAGDDGNSSQARSVATDYIFQNLDSVLLVGRGWGSSYALKGQVLQTSLENGYAILAFDIGGLMVLLLLAVQLRIAFARGSIQGAWLGALTFIAGGFTYSGIVTMSSISMIGWLVLAFCLEGVDRRAELRAEKKLRNSARGAPAVSQRVVTGDQY